MEISGKCSPLGRSAKQNRGGRISLLDSVKLKLGLYTGGHGQAKGLVETCGMGEWTQLHAMQCDESLQFKEDDLEKRMSAGTSKRSVTSGDAGRQMVRCSGYCVSTILTAEVTGPGRRPSVESHV